ncbi:MAG: protein kinase domain-containing protein [Nannocystaceae bacterium]|nr:serine/threonine protein kinase [bacterium]
MPTLDGDGSQEPEIGLLATHYGEATPLSERFRRAQLRAQMFGDPGEVLRVGRYEITGQIGSGAMGTVYRAKDPSLDREVAVKVLHRSDEMHRARMTVEAKALAKLSHPNVVTVHEVGTHEGQLFVAMEFVQGKTLQTWLERPEGPAVLDVFAQAARGLQAAHDAGIVHRDFKPENVIVGDDGRVRVLDFGMARSPGAPLLKEIAGEAQPVQALEPAITRTGILAGTPGYMAPEQFEGARVDAPADQFAFCIALHEAIWGERPFPGETAAELAASVLDGRADMFEGTPRGGLTAQEVEVVKSVVERGLSTDPANRYASMDALIDRLRRTRRPAATGLRQRLAVGLGASALVAVGAFAATGMPDFVAASARWMGLTSEPPTAASSATEPPSSGRCALGMEQRNGTCLPIEWDPRFVRCNDEGCSVDRALLIGVGEQPPLVLRQTRMIPTRNERGTPLGFKAFGVRKDTAAGMLGFQNGDIVRTVNDIKLDADPASFLADLTAEVQTADTLTVIFERDGAVQELAIGVHGERPSAAPIVPSVPGELPAVSDLPSVHVGPTTLAFDTMTLATVTDGEIEASQMKGHLVLPLHDHLSEWNARKGGDRLALYADASLPFDALVDVLYSSGSAGFRVYELVAQTPSGTRGALQVAPPMYPDAPGKREPLRVEIDSEGFTLGGVLIPRVEGRQGIDAYDFAALEDATRAHRTEYASTRAVLTADGDTRYDLVLRTLATLRGETCTTDPRTCVMTHLSIEAGAQ